MILTFISCLSSIVTFIGGIATFTPHAILNDPYGVLKLIREIHHHPLWECYILPYVLGLATGLAQQLGDSFASDLISGDLCRAIEDGEIASIEAPHIDPHPWMDLNQDLAWVQRQQSFPRDPATLLTKWYNKEWYNKQCADGSGESRQSSTIDNIAKNMLAMSLQPVFMDNYRRFVVITDATDEKVRFDSADPHKTEPVLNDWLEWHTLGSFSFKDDFFRY